MSTRAVAAVLVAAVVGTAAVSAQTPKSALLVMLRMTHVGGTLAIVDPASGKIVGRIRVGQDPHGVDVSADGATAFVVNNTGEDGNSLSVIDLAAKKEVRRIQVPQSTPHDLQVAGGKVYFTAAGRKAIGRYDPARNTTVWLSTGEHTTRTLNVSEARDEIYATSTATRSFLILQGVSGSPTDVKVTVIPLGHPGEDIAVSPDGSQAWTTNNDGTGITIVDVVNKRIQQTVPVKSSPNANRIAMSPDGTRVLLLDRDPGETIILDAIAKKELKRINHNGSVPGGGMMGILGVAVAPDSSRAFVSVSDIRDVKPPDRDYPVKDGKHHIAVIDLKTLAVINRIPTDMPGDEMIWVEMR